MAGMPAAARFAIAIRAGSGRLPVRDGAHAARAPNEPKTTLTGVAVAFAREHHADLDLLLVVDRRLQRGARLLAVLGRDREQQRAAHQGAVEGIERRRLAALLRLAGGEHGVEEVGRALLDRSGRT